MVYTLKPKESKVCALPSCAIEFETAKARQRFHSNECKVEYHRRLQMNQCPHCGEELIRA